MDSLEIEGKEYVSAKRAAREHGYTMDYIGQLIRAEKLFGKKVGRAWYVETGSLLSYVSAPLQTEVLKPHVIAIKKEETPTEVREEVVALVEVEETKKEEIEELVPEVKKPYEYLPVRPPHREIERPKVALNEVFAMKYLSDDEPAFPRIEVRKTEVASDDASTVSSIYIRTMQEDMRKEPLPAIPLRYKPEVRTQATAGTLMRVLGAMAGAAAVVVLISVIASSVFLDKTITFNGKEVTAGVSFSSFNY